MMLAGGRPAERAEATTLAGGSAPPRVVIDLCGVDDEDAPAAEQQVQNRRRRAREVAQANGSGNEITVSKRTQQPCAIAPRGRVPCGLDAPTAPHLARNRHSRTAACGAAALQAVSARETDTRVGTELITGPSKVVVLVRRRAGARTPHAPSRTDTHRCHFAHASRPLSCVAPRFDASVC
jgi:hypothetical protein